MKHLKLFEDYYEKRSIPFRSYYDPIAEENFKIDDVVYCIDNHDGALQITIGESYIIQKMEKWDNRMYFFIYDNDPDIVDNDFKKTDGFSPSRFTKDPNHPIVIQATANKYNI